MMRATNVVVCINLDSFEEISNLNGIGPKLANRIIEYRQVNGPFNGPDDLLKIEGIHKRLALKLTSQIDWRTTREEHHIKSENIDGIVEDNNSKVRNPNLSRFIKKIKSFMP